MISFNLVNIKDQNYVWNLCGRITKAEIQFQTATFQNQICKIPAQEALDIICCYKYLHLALISDQLVVAATPLQTFRNTFYFIHILHKYKL